MSTQDKSRRNDTGSSRQGGTGGNSVMPRRTSATDPKPTASTPATGPKPTVSTPATGPKPGAPTNVSPAHFTAPPRNVTAPGNVAAPGNIANRGTAPVEPGTAPRSVQYGDHYERVNRKKALQANVQYVDSNNYQYTTDEHRRISNVQGELNLGDAKRNQYAQSHVGGADRLSTDVGGHLIGRQFNGSGQIDNLLPMDGAVNGSGGEWYQMEKLWADALRQGHKVEVNISPTFTDESARPDSFQGEYYIDGEFTPINILNTKAEEDQQNSDRQAAEQKAQQEQARKAEEAKATEAAKKEQERKAQEESAAKLKAEEAKKEQERKAQEDREAKLKAEAARKAQEKPVASPDAPNASSNQVTENARQQADEAKRTQDSAAVSQHSQSQEALRNQIATQKTETDAAKAAQHSQEQEQRRQQLSEEERQKSADKEKSDGVDVKTTYYNMNLHSSQTESSLYQSSTEHTNLNLMGTSSNTSVDVSVGPDGLDASARAGVEAHMAQMGAHGETNIAGMDMSGNVNLTLMQAHAEADAGAHVGKDGISANANLSAGVNLVSLEASGEIETALGTAHGDVSAQVGPNAYAQGELAFGIEDGKLNAHAGGEIGANLASVEAEGGFNFLGLIDVKGTAEASVGVSAKAGIGIEDNKFYMNLGASLGIGGSVGVEIDFSGLVDAAGEAWEGITDVAEEAWEGVTDFAGDAVDAIGDGINNVVDFLTFWD